jgi:hypothetical protein
VYSSTMFENLVQFEPDTSPPGNFENIERVDAGAVLSAQAATADWLLELGVTPDDEVEDGLHIQSARKAFSTLTTVTSDEEQKLSLTRVKTPAAVQHLVGMLTAYDWEFIEQAKSLRGYTVAKIVEETKNPNASIRLKALTLLGKVTEVGLFTEKIEIKKVEMSDSEIDQRIKGKLNRFMSVVDVEDVQEVPPTNES